DDIVTLRTKFLLEYRPRAPSSAGDLTEFLKRQENPDQMIYCNRPLHASVLIPVTLLHPIFGQFIDDCDNYKPTAKDNAFVLELSTAMTQFYQDETDQANRIRQVFRDKYDIDFLQTVIEGTTHSTDGDEGDTNRRNLPFALIEFKNDVGSKESEPFVQSVLRYLESTRKQAPEMPCSVLPCMIINVFGPHMSFVGAAWNVRPVAQVLSTGLPFYFDFSDTKLRATAARHLGAFKKAIHSLQDYYHNDVSVTSPTLIPWQIFPYRKHFTSLVDSSEQQFEYVKKHEHYRLLFLGKLSDGRYICIKFSRQEVHSFCALKGFAPKLLGCEMIPGGWWMVVMDLIDENRVEFYDPQAPLRSSILKHLREFLTLLHGKDFVHDTHNTNTVVPRSGASRLILVDFDRAGRIRNARYPMNVHYGVKLRHLMQDTIFLRPDGARDGELITADS
ncbi:hypothetical protein M378DRAFT_86656, partial [Amanita muscaria Koide BX008]